MAAIEDLAIGQRIKLLADTPRDNDQPVYGTIIVINDPPEDGHRIGILLDRHYPTAHSCEKAKWEGKEVQEGYGWWALEKDIELLEDEIPPEEQ